MKSLFVAFLALFACGAHAAPQDTSNKLPICLVSTLDICGGQDVGRQAIVYDSGGGATPCATGGGTDPATSYVVCTKTPAGWIASGSAGAATPGGNNTDVQFNSSGSLAGSDNFKWDGTTLKIVGGLRGFQIDPTAGGGSWIITGLSDPASASYLSLDHITQTDYLVGERYFLANHTFGGGSTLTWTFDVGATDLDLIFGLGVVAFDVNKDGVPECTITSAGLTCNQISTDNHEADAGGNQLSLLPNDTTNANIACADTPSNSLAILDSDQSSNDQYDVCVNQTRVSTLGWAPFNVTFLLANADPDTSTDNRCLYLMDMITAPATYTSATVATCFNTTNAFAAAFLKPTGKAMLVQNYFCYLDNVAGETTGDTLDFELIEDTIGSGSPTIKSTISFVAGTDMTDNTFKSASSLPIAMTSAEAGLAVRVQWTDAGSDGATSNVRIACTVQGIVQP